MYDHTTMYDDNVWPHLAQCMSILTTIYDPIYDPTKLGHGCPKPDWGIIAGTHFLRIKFSEGLNIVAILIPSGFDWETFCVVCKPYVVEYKLKLNDVGLYGAQFTDLPLVS